MAVMNSAVRSILVHVVWEIYVGVELLGSRGCIYSHLVVAAK